MKWKLVPVEPTQEMIKAGADVECIITGIDEIDAPEDYKRVFMAMLEAAPPAPSVPDGWKHDCAGILVNDVELWVDSCPHCGKPRPAAAPTPPEPSADLARDAARYRWLRNPEQEVGLVLDKRVGFREYDEGTRTGGYPLYEYRSGEELDAAIDAAIEREKMKGGEA